MNQSVENPNEGSPYTLTCTFTLPNGVSPDLLNIEWSGHRSVMSSDPRVIISNTTSVGMRQYAKTLTFQPVQSVDNGNYTCVVNIAGFDTYSSVIMVNGE